MKYVLQKVGLFVLTLWAAITLNFFLPRLMPGSPADAAIAKLAQNGPVSDATRAAIEAQLGVPTGSIWEQYVTYLGQVARLDFGVSYTFYPQSVSSMVSTALPYTIGLVGIVTILAFVIGTLIGVMAAWRRGTWLDSLPTLTGSFLSTFPYFWTALLLLFFLGYVLHWFPTTGAYSATTTPGFTLEFIGDLARHAVLPALTLGLLTAGIFLRLVRANMIGTLGSEYVDAARSRGVREARLVRTHAFRPALVPIITVMGLQIAMLLGGSVLTETTFGWRGLGFELNQYLSARDFVAVQGIVAMLAVIVAVTNFVVDVVAALIDPRVRF